MSSTLPMATKRSNFSNNARPKYAALITDIRMPGNCSGLDLAQRVASRWPWISILVTSGYYSERPPGLPQQAQFLSKPWEPEVILDFVQWAVRSDFG